MNQKQLLETIAAMKMQILELLLNANLANDKQAQRTFKTIENMFKRLDLDVEDVIPVEVLQNYFNGVDEATKALSKVGVDPVNGLSSAITSSGQVASAFDTHVHMEAIAAITDDLMLDFKSAIRTARQNTYFTLKTTLAEVKEDLQKGIIQGNSRRVITQRVAESFAKDGMKAFKTIDNKWLPLDFYSQTITRTNLKMTHTQGAGGKIPRKWYGFVYSNWKYTNLPSMCAFEGHCFYFESQSI
ncbi:hypothetical protein RWE15_14440 [Virgibacillus halophilus]|uniref:LXG domain of WXG superfamily protein n=1 Tax=Tigheibacillus halophilus TaxID=361280 RepID=A0ABU5C878_9BACI|nr:hypothetical protein [Virgibacillus halophilus]